MAGREINITLKAKDEASAKLAKASKATSDFIVNIKKMGNAFGEVGSSLGGFLSNIAKGGIWGIAQEVVHGAVGLLKGAYDSLKESMPQGREEGIYRTGMSNAEWSQPRMQTLMTIKASHIRHPPRDLGPFAHPSGPDGFFNPSANPALKSSHFCMTEVV